MGQRKTAVGCIRREVGARLIRGPLGASNCRFQGGGFRLFRCHEHLRPVDAGVAAALHVEGSTHLREVGVHDVGAVVRTGDPRGADLSGRALARSDVLAYSLPCITCARGAAASLANLRSAVLEAVARAM